MSVDFRSFVASALAIGLFSTCGFSAERRPLQGSLPSTDAKTDVQRPELSENSPAAQVLVPGFTVRQLPVELSNVNNLKYRADGTLVALAYDGTVWLLRDTDGDGLEDQSQLFWDNPNGLRAPIGMDLTPPEYSRGVGLCVAGKDRCVLIVDTNGDERADKEIVVASGWKESFHQVDGLGVAFHPRDGSIYFGRGTYNFADPYLRDEKGHPHYGLNDESGAILRVLPDFDSREILATGIRFPVALRFNAEGDLFATDQEGATWVPNGNPFDELLHIRRGRHYGFPARHPDHLPGVIDEPSTFDYAPQHQSTCGLNFNIPMQSGGPVFGPSAWEGDAIVAGYSRGKLYRTELVKSAAGYVARTHILASLSMLTVDACISPGGDLVVACHSGGPDWGSGPTGKGKLFQIRYVDRDHPQPSVAYPTSPREVRVEFDRPVEAQHLRDMLHSIKLTAGAYVRAGDRFETLSPGYAAVEAQKQVPRSDVTIHSAQLTANSRTLVLATDPLIDAVHYALQLPGMGRADEAPGGDALPQAASIDLDFDMTGCEATWRAEDGSFTWNGWLPHPDLVVSRALTDGSATHAALWDAMRRPGELTLRFQLDLNDMLRPAVQPGSELDYAYPPEEVTVTFDTASPEVELALPVVDQATATRSGSRVSLTLPAQAEKVMPVVLSLKCSGRVPKMTVSWTTNEDDRPRPLALRRVTMPWFERDSGERALPIAASQTELEGGSWGRGYREFFGEKAACSKCHAIQGRGNAIGPDLSNLVHRDYASVLRDIVHPSYAINPDYLSYTVVLTDGRVLTGVVHSSNESLRIGDANGTIEEVKRSDVVQIEASSVSAMPEGLAAQLGEHRLRDLMTFLLTPAPRMPQAHEGPRAVPRRRAEVEAVLGGAPEPAGPIRPIRLLLVAGPKDHGPGEHDYPAWQATWAELLRAADNVEVATASEWPAPNEWNDVDVAVIYQRGDWNDRRAADVDAHLARGGGLVLIHWATSGRGRARDYAERIGLAADDQIAFRHGETSLRFNSKTDHPVIRNFDSLTLVDEIYWKLAGSLPEERVLGVAADLGEPQLWTLERGNGRVFVSIPGHYSTTFDDPLFRVLLLRGIAWAAREPVDRFNELVWPGANLAD